MGSIGLLSAQYLQLKSYITIPGCVLIYVAIGIRMWIRSRSSTSMGGPSLLLYMFPHHPQIESSRHGSRRRRTASRVSGQIYARNLQVTVFHPCAHDHRLGDTARHTDTVSLVGGELFADATLHDHLRCERMRYQHNVRPYASILLHLEVYQYLYLSVADGEEVNILICTLTEHQIIIITKMESQSC
jgi:hypothetical protein